MGAVARWIIRVSTAVLRWSVAHPVIAVTLALGFTALGLWLSSSDQPIAVRALGYGAYGFASAFLSGAVTGAFLTSTAVVRSAFKDFGLFLLERVGKYSMISPLI